MPRKKKLFSIRKPRITLSKKGKVGVTNIGARVGTKKAGVNISRKGISASGNVRGISASTSRGLGCNPFTFFFSLFGKK